MRKGRLLSAERREAILVVALALLAFAAAAAMAWFVFERLPHLEDEVAYVFQARVMARGALWAPTPDNPAPFWVPFVLTVGERRFAKYPPGWPVVLAVGEWLGAAWLVNPLLGALSVALLYLLGRDLFDRPTAALACLLMAASPMFLVLSGSLMPHALALALGLVFMLATYRVERALQRTFGWRAAGWAALAGAALGWVAITRPLTAVSLTLPFVGLVAWRVRGNLSVRTLAPFTLLAGAALAVAALYPAYVWALTGDPTTNLYTMWWPYDKIGFGPDISPSNGHTLQQAVVNARADLELWASDLFGWPSLSWIFLLPGVAARRRSAWGWTLLALFPSFVVVHLAYWVGSQVYGTRYYYEALPGLTLLTAAGMRWLVGLRLSGRWRQAALATLVAVLLAVNAVFYLPGRVQELRALNTITRAPLVRLAERQEGDVLVVARAERWWEYGALMAQTSPWLDGPLVVARDIVPSATEAAIAAYPDRQLIYFYRGHFHEEKPY